MPKIPNTSMTMVIALLAISAGCAVTDSRLDARAAHILAHTTYNHLGAELNQNCHVPEHDPDEMVRLFDANKSLLAYALAPYLETYDGKRYPQIAVSVYAKPVAPDGALIDFHVSVDACLSPKAGSGTRRLLDDSYAGGLLFDPVEGRVVGVNLMGSQCRSIPSDVFEKATTLAREFNPRYSQPDEGHARWLPPWYVNESILPRRRSGETVADQYAFITEEPEGHVILIPFPLFCEPLPGDEIPCHTVVIDMGAERVLGVHEGMIDLSPRFK